MTRSLWDVVMKEVQEEGIRLVCGEGYELVQADDNPNDALCVKFDGPTLRVDGGYKRFREHVAQTLEWLKYAVEGELKYWRRSC